MMMKKNLQMLVLMLGLSLSFNGLLYSKISSFSFYNKNNEQINSPILFSIFNDFKVFNENVLEKKIFLAQKVTDYKFNKCYLKKEKLMCEINLKKLIKKIYFKGSEYIKQDDLLDEFKKDLIGKFYEDVKDKLLNDIKAYYIKKGFEEVKVRVNYKDKGVYFYIEEGKPYYVSDINLELKNSIFSKEKLLKFIDIRKEIFSSEKLNGKINNLRNYLHSNGFYSSYIYNKKINKNNNNLVDIDLGLYVGPKFVINFKGNKFIKDNKELKDALNITYTDVINSDYYQVLINRLKEFYLSEGFKDVKITVLENIGFKEKSIELNFKIDEGIRYFLSDYKFVTNRKELSSDLHEFIKNKYINIFETGIYIKNNNDLIKKELIQYLKAKGYFRAQIRRIENKIRKNKLLEVVFYISEGMSASLRRVNFVGNKTFDDNVLKELMYIKENDIFDLEKVNKSLKNIKDFYIKEGFSSFTLDKNRIIKITKDNRFINLNLHINEGNKNKFGNVFISGLNDTDSKVVKRELVFKTNQILDKNLINETEENISNVGLFSNVIIEVLPSSSLGSYYKDIAIKVKEKKAGLYEVGFGYGTDKGVIIYTGASYSNISGMNRRLNFDSEVNRKLDSRFDFIEYDLSFAYYEPYFLSFPLGFRIIIGTSKNDYPSYGKINSDVGFYFEKRIKNNFLSVGNVIERIEIFNSNLTEGNNNYWKYYFKPLYRYDGRNSIFNPTKGVYFISYLKWGYALEQGLSSSFIKGYQKTRFYIPIIHDFNSVISLGLGYIKNLSGKGVLIDERFELGGLNSIRGYEWNAISDLSLNLKEQYFYSLNFELRKNIFWNFVANVFYDLGGISNQNLNQKGPFSSIGGGLAWRFSFGSISLQYGYIYKKNDRINNEKVGRLHFSLGTF
jgi:outer membrane protein insertion porin family